MRWLFLFVLSLNLAYIVWQTSVSSERPNIHVQSLKNVPPIVLLRELKPQSVLVDEVRVSASQQEERTEEGNHERLAVVEKEITVEETRSARIESGQAEAVETVVTTSDAADTKKPEMKLEAEKVVSAVVAEQPVSRESCYTLGPFRNLDKLRSFIREIKSYVVEVDFRGREESEQSLFWVYIQPEVNHKKAIETGNRLKQKKIKDFYIIREGEKIHGISLGHFRNKEGAYGLVKKVQKLGFDVHVEPVFKTYTVYWLDYQLASGVSIPESILDQYIKAAQKDKISRLSRDCGN